MRYRNEMKNPKLRRLRLRLGFTLVELMVVIALVAMLAGAVTLSVRSYLIKGKQNIAKVEISKFVQAIDSFYTAYDRYPTNEEGLYVLAQPSDEFAEGLLTSVPKDPWKNEYEYRCPGENSPYEVICFGDDRREGGDGAARDITSMELSGGS